MANDTMKKVQELLEMVGLDKEVIKSVTEKLNESDCKDDKNCKGDNCTEKTKKDQGDDTVPVNPDAEAKAKEDEETKKSEEDEETKKSELTESATKEAKVKFQEEDDEHSKKAPVDACLAKGIHEDEEITEALYVLRDAIQEARDQYVIMEKDLATLKEEYAKLVAEKIITESYINQLIEESEKSQVQLQLEDEADSEKEGAEEDEAETEEDHAKTDEEKKEKHEEEGDKDEAEGKKKEAKKEDKEADKDEEHAEEDKEKAEEDEEKADESFNETAEQILNDIKSLSESEEKAPKKAKVFSVFSNLNESVGETKKTRKVFTLFPNL